MGQVNCCRGSRDDPDPEQQCAPVPPSPEPLLHQRVRVTQGHATRKRDLLLFSDALVIAKPHSRALKELWVSALLGRRDPQQEEGAALALCAARDLGRCRGAGAVGLWRQGALFGRPLAALCSQDGTLPQPIQDLLALLREHGPSTEGIFRLAAGERASRELREALDSGAEVHLESQPAHLLAVILKDFLRKIPSKLLQAELYEEWMSALHKTSRQERLAGLKEVASKLPKGNLLLLKSLLSLLQDISRNAATSRMTAGNLAVCVGPNLLSPAEEHTLPWTSCCR
ncbi:T-cell activation Rho GTPase-activating protein-like [Gymnogyps californianus]|uniref:T-cell activation Rho GTPase-activating protein-like n=1 Tax=Gymnogyps californianus TaxID=33616 RepID=UPI0021C60A7B|nr:T-cell activation Rho GTPase-activating protein-like [Gymnogyps californianus]